MRGSGCGAQCRVYGAAASTASLTIEARMLSMDSATDTKGSDEPYRNKIKAMIRN